MLKTAKKVVSIIDQTAFGVSTVLLVVLTVFAVLRRFVLNNPVTWAEEVQMILVVWSVFFGASIAIREHGHIAVDILFDALPKPVKKVLNVLIWIIVAVSIAGIGKLEVDRVSDLIRSGLRTPVLGLYSAVEYIGVIIGCVLMFLSHVIDGLEGLIRVYKKEDAA